MQFARHFPAGTGKVFFSFFLGSWHFPVSLGMLGFSRAFALPCQHGHIGVFWGLGTSLSAWASWGFLGPWHFPAGVGKLGFSRALASPLGQIGLQKVMV